MMITILGTCPAIGAVLQTTQAADPRDGEDVQPTERYTAITLVELLSSEDTLLW